MSNPVHAGQNVTTSGGSAAAQPALMCAPPGLTLVAAWWLKQSLPGVLLHMENRNLDMN